MLPFASSPAWNIGPFRQKHHYWCFFPPYLCLYYVFRYCLRCCSFEGCRFSNLLAFRPNELRLSSLFCWYQQRLNDHTDRCSPIFRSLLKGKPLKLSNIIDCFSSWQMTVKFTFVLFILFLSILYCQLAVFSPSVILLLVFTFVFSSSPFLCGNSCERWVLCVVGTNSVSNYTARFGFEACHLSTKAPVYGFQLMQYIHWWPYWRKRKSYI